MASQPNGEGGTGGADGSGQAGDDGLTDQYVDLPQLISRRLAAAANQLVEFAAEQPVAAAAVIAGGAGVLIGLWLAGRSRSESERVADRLQDQLRKGGKARKRLRRARDYGELLPLAMNLLENPVIRGLIVRMVMRSLTKRRK